MQLTELSCASVRNKREQYYSFTKKLVDRSVCIIFVRALQFQKCLLVDYVGTPLRPRRHFGNCNAR